MNESAITVVALAVYGLMQVILRVLDKYDQLQRDRVAAQERHEIQRVTVKTAEKVGEIHHNTNSAFLLQLQTIHSLLREKAERSGAQADYEEADRALARVNDYLRQLSRQEKERGPGLI